MKMDLILILGGNPVDGLCVDIEVKQEETSIIIITTVASYIAHMSVS